MLLAGSGLMGCVPRRQPPVVAPPPPPPVVVAPAPVAPPPPAKRITLTVLPAEKFLLPKVATAINERLARLHMAGVDEVTTAPISMATAQLQAECTDTGEACWAKVAAMLETDRLLWAEMERAPKAKKGPVKVSLILFDGERATVLARTEQMFTPSTDEAAVDKLLDPVVGPAQPASPPPPAQAAPAIPVGATP